MPYLIGVVLALTVSVFAAVVGLDRDRAFYPTVLIVIACYYVLFAVIGGSSHAVLVETLVMAGFLLLAAIGFRGNLWLVVAALAGHGIFDLVHRRVVTNPGVPAWWPAFCLTYDITAAALLGWLLITRGDARARVTLLGLLLLSVPACSAPSATLVLRGGTLINPDASRVPNANVSIEHGRIICAGAAEECPPPSGARVMDLPGTYIGPGMVDAHVHYSQTGWLDGRPDVINLRAQYPYDSVVAQLSAHPERFNRAYLCSGVTSVFDVGGFPWTLDLAKKSREARDAPRIVATGPLLSTIQVAPDMRGAFAFMKDEATVEAAVRADKAGGAEAIKVWYISVADSLRAHSKAMLLAAAAQARKAGLRLVVHATEPASAREAVEAGAAVLVHEVDSDTVSADLVEFIKQSGTIVIPTVSVYAGYADVLLGRSPALRYPLDCVDSITQGKLGTILPDSVRAAGKAFWNGPMARAMMSNVTKNLLRMYDAGIPIAMGTDAGNPGTAHGPSVFAEMEAMQQAGMPARAVFASATIVAARALGLDQEIGSVEEGKRADLAVFGADPSADIRNARQVRLVIRNGVEVRR